MTWVAPHTWVDGETITTAKLNTDLRDNLTDLYQFLGYRTTKTNWRPYLNATAIAANVAWAWSGGGTAPDADTVPPGGWLIVCWGVEFKTSVASPSINHHISANIDPVSWGSVLTSPIGDSFSVYRTLMLAAHWSYSSSILSLLNPTSSPITVGPVPIVGYAGWAATAEYNSRVAGGTTPIVRETIGARY